MNKEKKEKRKRIKKMIKRIKDKTVVEKGNMNKWRRHIIKLSKINRTIGNRKYEVKRH